MSRMGRHESIKGMIEDRLADVKSGSIAEETFPDVLADDIDWYIENSEL